MPQGLTNIVKYAILILKNNNNQKRRDKLPSLLFFLKNCNKLLNFL